MPTIAIDLMPLRPGGINGGAKVLVWQLLRQLLPADTSYDYVLLTAVWNDAELAEFDGPRCRRVCLQPDEAVASGTAVNGNGRLLPLLENMRRRLPYSLVKQILPFARHLKTRLPHTPPKPRYSTNTRLRPLGVDLLFCPFTAVALAEPGIPTVSLVYDLQHVDYPQFFSGAELQQRTSFFAHLVNTADFILCISEFTRQKLLSQFPQLQADRTGVATITIHERLTVYKAETAVSSELNLSQPYLFYPANFWPHKNHQMLLTAFNMFVHRHPQQPLNLILTGDLPEAEQSLRQAAAAMGLADRVQFLGYLPEAQLAAVYQNCTAVIFPSLYEGFGIPVLEALTFDKPVLCSNVGSLPEVAGEAALYFNPRIPTEIVSAIERILGEPALTAVLSQRGQQRLQQFQTDTMVQQYLRTFTRTLKKVPA